MHVDDDHFPDTIRERVLPHLETANLQSVTIPVVMYTSAYVERVIDEPGDNGWKANCAFLRCLRKDDAASHNIERIIVSITYECDYGEGRGAFLRQAELHKPWFHMLEQELLKWGRKPHFECVIVEVADLSRMEGENPRRIIEEDMPLVFSRLARRGLLSAE